MVEIYSFYLFLFSKSQPAYLFELLQPLGITVELPWFRVQGIRTLLLPIKNEKKKKICLHVKVQMQSIQKVVMMAMVFMMVMVVMENIGKLWHCYYFSLAMCNANNNCFVSWELIKYLFTIFFARREIFKIPRIRF